MADVYQAPGIYELPGTILESISTMIIGPVAYVNILISHVVDYAVIVTLKYPHPADTVLYGTGPEPSWWMNILTFAGIIVTMVTLCWIVALLWRIAFGTRRPAVLPVTTVPGTPAEDLAPLLSEEPGPMRRAGTFEYVGFSSA